MAVLVNPDTGTVREVSGRKERVLRRNGWVDYRPEPVDLDE